MDPRRRQRQGQRNNQEQANGQANQQNQQFDIMVIFKKIIFEIQRIANKLGVHHCYIYGGTVRDLLRRNYSRDISIVIERENFLRLINQLSKKFRLQKKSSIKTILGLGSKLFKTSINNVLVRIREVSTRTDTTSVRSLLEDEHRNCDFTVNSMFIDLMSLNNGSFENGFDFHDFCGGMRDLEKGVLKTTVSLEKTFDKKFARFIRLIRVSEENNFEINRNITKYVLDQSYHSKWSYFDLIKHEHEFCRVIESNYFADIIDVFFKLQLNMLIDDRYHPNTHTFIVQKLKNMPDFDVRNRDEKIQARKDYLWNILLEATHRNMGIDAQRWRPLIFGIHC